MGQALNIAKNFYDATNLHGREIDALLPQIGGFLADDFKFSGPLMTSRGSAEYLKILKQFLQFHAEYRFIKQFEEGNDVCSIYELIVNTPGGNRLTIPMADYLKISDGKIQEQVIYYDPRGFAEAFGMAQL